MPEIGQRNHPPGQMTGDATASELARMNRALRMLSSSNQALIRASDETALLQNVCRNVVEEGGYRMAMVAFAENDPAKTLRPVAHAGFESGYGESARLSWDEHNERGRGPGGQTIRSGRPSIARNILADPAFAPWREDAVQRSYHSVLVLPLKNGEAVFGALGIYSAEPDAFDEAETTILGEMANDLAYGIMALREQGRLRDAEKRLRANLHFFESTDRVNRAILGADDFDALMRGVLEVTLDVLGSDRAFLMYPCDPDAADWRVPMECTRQEYPGASELGVTIPMTDDVAASLRPLLATDGPVTFGPSGEFPLPTEVAERFGFKTYMSMAIHPKGDRPWQFGIHQCSRQRAWTADDRQLFQALGQRLSDALTSLISNCNLKLSEEKYRRIVDTSQEGIWILDADSLTTFVNSRMETMLGYSESEILGRPVTDFMFEQDLPDFERRKNEWSPEKAVSYERRYRRKDGSTVWVLVSATYILDADGATTGSFAMFSDITERKAAEESLRIAAAAFEAQEGILVTDAAQVILRVNRAFNRITGYSSEDVVGQTTHILQSGRHDADFYHEMWQRIRTDGAWQGEIWNRRKSGEVYPAWLSISVVHDEEGAVSHYVGTVLDLTPLKAAEQEIEHLAYFDPLTQLPNRRLFLDRLQQALAGAGRSGRKGALLFIDLDNFKILNETRGHDVGDHLLVEVAKRLGDNIRDGDTVARLGGDEFVVLLEDLGETAHEAAAQARHVAEKVRAVLGRPYSIAGSEHHSTPSVGVTLFAENAESVEELLKQADIAMYQAKADGRDTLRFFDPEMQESLADRARMEAALHQAVRESQFVLHYQPQIDAVRGIVGAEALVRWAHPERGLVPPLQFIPLAEETGLILEIGRWLLVTACGVLRDWAGKSPTRGLNLAVNVSARQFRQADFVEQVRTALNDSGAPPARLKIELTESLVLDDIEDTIVKMQALKALGVGFSMDDFGTGYSSLAYLTRLPLDQLKIDQSFVRNLPDSPNDAAVAQTIIALAKSLGLEVIAEGVETEAQRLFLAEHGCPTYQGYMFSRPVELGQFERLLAGNEVST